MPDVERDIGLYGEAFIDWMVPFARLNGVTEVVCESPIIVQHRDERTGKTSVNGNEIEKLVSMFAFASYATRQLGLPKMTRAPRGTVCQHFICCGPRDPDYRRKYLKGAVVARVQFKGWGTQTEDTADALATLDWYVWDHRVNVAWNCQPAIAKLFAGTGAVKIDDGSKARASALLRSSLSFNREHTDAKE